MLLKRKMKGGESKIPCINPGDFLERVVAFIVCGVFVDD